MYNKIYKYCKKEFNIKEYGYKILRFWESKLKQTPNIIINKLNLQKTKRLANEHSYSESKRS